MWRLSDFAVDHPKLTILLILLLTLAIVPGARNLRIDSDFEKQIPKTHHIIVHNENYKEIFGDKKTIYLAVVNKQNSIYNPQTLKVIAALSQEIKEIPDLIEANTYSVADSKDIKGIGDFLDVKYLIDEDYIPQTPEEIAEFRKAAEANPLFYGKSISEDGTTAIISFDVRGDWEKPVTGPMVTALVEKYQTDEIEIHATGAMVLWDIDKGVSTDMNTLVPFAVVLVMIGLFFSFRTARGVFIPIAMIAFANLGTLGMMGYLGFDLSPITLYRSYPGRRPRRLLRHPLPAPILRGRRRRWRPRPAGGNQAGHARHGRGSDHGRLHLCLRHPQPADL